LIRGYRIDCIIAAVLALWNIIITLCWPLLYFYRPFRGTIGKRLGGFDLGSYNPGAAELKVLINAVSAGEVAAAAPFIRELLRARPQAQVVVLTTTDSGQAMAREKLGSMISLLAYFPLADLPFVVRRYLERLKPDLYVTLEAELWPNIMNACQRRGIPVAQLNARIYLHNKAGWRGRLHRRLYALTDRIVCQSEQQRENFIAFGVSADKLVVSGNTKFDIAVEEWDGERLAERRRRYGAGAGRLLVAGSTHEGEEELLLDALKRLRNYQRVKLIVAPRHIERAEEVMQLSRERGLTAELLSNARTDSPWDVLVVDSYGLLVDCYRLADVVVMGGTFHPKVGGHNLLEATALGQPVLVGPHTFSITAQLAMLRAVDGVLEVPDGEALTAELKRLLGDDALGRQIGRAARQATEANRGAAERAVKYVLELLPR